MKITKKQRIEEFSALLAEKFITSGNKFTCAAVFMRHVEIFANSLCALEKNASGHVIRPRQIMNRGFDLLMVHYGHRK